MLWCFGALVLWIGLGGFGHAMLLLKQVFVLSEIRDGLGHELLDNGLFSS